MSNHIQNRHSFNIKTNISNNSENVFRYSYPNSRPDILHTKFDIPIKKSTIKRLSNKSVDSQDSGIGLSKADYEIRRAIKAQIIIERPQIIVIHKGRPIMTSRNNYNNSNSEDLDADAHMIISAATASKIHRREIAVMQKRNTIISSSSLSSSSLSSLSPSSSLSSPSSSSLYNNDNFEKENAFNGFEFTRSNDMESNDIKKEIDNYEEKKKPRGCSFLKSKPSIKRVSSVIKKLVGKEKRFMTCVYVN